MGVLIKLNHKTEYKYDKPILLGPQLIRLKPAAHSRTRILSWGIKVLPEKHFINNIQDAYGNFLTRILFTHRVEHFSIEINLTADLVVVNPFDFFLESDCEFWPISWQSSQRENWKNWFKTSEQGPLFNDFLNSITHERTPTIEFLVKLNQHVWKTIQYKIRMEPNIQSPEETLRLRSGSCRDSAVLLVELLRHLDLPARFVSGYLIQLKPDQRPLHGPFGPEEDFTDLHAWAEVFIPGAGWIGLDPTSGLLTGEGHIPLAVSPDPLEAAPVSGTLEPCHSTFHYSMQVSRLKSAPRPSLPFPQGGEDALDTVGKLVDERLSTLGYTLTIGAEPTFVSDTDRQSTEWNSEALGPTKKKIGYQLLKRLAGRWSYGGVTVHKQGKWYPGESLPRWSLCHFWIPDQQLWNKPELQADLNQQTHIPHPKAEVFIHALARRLGVSEDFILPAYEDPIHLLKTERDLPLNLIPGDPRLSNSEDRNRLAQILSRGPDVPVGWVLPLAKGSWKSSRWPNRCGRLLLLPGDSPIGLRLPLDTLPWAAPEEATSFFEIDPFATSSFPTKPKVPLTIISPYQPTQEISEQMLQNDQDLIKPGQPATWVVRTALTTQVREGILYVFFPPLRTAQDWAELLAEVEKTAEELNVCVAIEGYTPPYDPRMKSFQITTDPGVLEVNMPPASSWEEWKSRLTELWEEARLCGLSTEKYLINGQTVGTGGGCHWILGGPTPQDSPFFKNTKLLSSWIVYLNKHPSLSYVFSGLFIGPTSQAPRFDEAHPQSLEHLRLALKSLEQQNFHPPWVFDRAFRNLLTDGSGNTHRAEICIDKLYNPDSSSGRLGLVEFRCFEMASHSSIALAQSLLLRALSLKFLEQPEKLELVEWGKALEDRWMLPHFLEEDLRWVLMDLERIGLKLPWDPFEAHLEFRFPLIGDLEWDGARIELRNALEPWPVTGEEPGAGGTVRFVDSSVERIQVKVTDWQPGKYALICREKMVPLAQTDDQTWVAGIRFKAWNLYSGLNPLIPADPKIVLEILDLASQKVVAGMTYFAAHPGGRNYLLPPVNAFEAESRRSARFMIDRIGGSSLSCIPQFAFSKDCPHTLDLRGC